MTFCISFRFIAEVRKNHSLLGQLAVRTLESSSRHVSIAGASHMASTKEDPVVDTFAGKIRGSVDRSCENDYFYSFKGIPYAKPPVGKLRFKDPVPVEPWRGIKDAIKFGSTCAQLEMVLQTYKGSDDCLFVNVYTKNLKPSKKQPVMFWIHGGAFMVGEGDDDIYGPDYFMRKDVVLVTLNYRLGVFGFLCLEDEVSPGNYGFKDQVLALKWVRDNIANFGGDPDNVTIFGESAGSASVHYLTLSPLAKGLFHKAIMESGTALSPWAFRENPSKNAYKLCEILGFNSRDHKKIIEFLQTVDCGKLTEAQNKVLSKEDRLKSLPFGPTTDAKSKNPFMPIHPEVAAHQGIHVPLMIGHNSRESLMFVNHGIEADKMNQNFVSQLDPKIIKCMKKNFDLTPEDLKRLYIKDGKITEENRERFVDLMSDMDFVYGIHRVVKIQAERSSASTYLFKYSFDKTPSPLKTILGITMSGACHADEMQHLFRSHKFEAGLSMEPHKKGTPTYVLMEKMIELWVNFATTGRPTPFPTNLIPFYWQPVNSGSVLRYLNIDEDLRMDVTLNLQEHLLAQKLTKNKL